MGKQIKTVLGILVIIFIVIFFSINRVKNWRHSREADDFPQLEGAYLGQAAPGSVPVLFVPGVVSGGLGEFASVFSPDGNRFYFCIQGPPRWTILEMKQIEGAWSRPMVAAFSGKYRDCDPMVSMDGSQLFYCSDRPRESDGSPRGDTDIWVIERNADGPASLRNLQIINSEGNEYYPSLAANGNLYFCSTRLGGKGGGDIYRSDYVGGSYLDPVNLGTAINGATFEGDVFISPDESYIIVTSYGRPDSHGSGDLYISFKDEKGTWGPLTNMGEGINSEANEHCPVVTADGLYFFFTSSRIRIQEGSPVPLTYRRIIELRDMPGNGLSDIYWVDASLIEKLRVN